MEPNHQTIEKDLFDKISRYIDSDRQPDQFTIASLKRDAEKLKGADAVARFMALGAIAALEFDEKSAINFHQNAIRLENSERTHEFFAVTLQQLGFFADAADEALIASEREPENLTILGIAIRYSLMAGRIRLAKELIGKFKDRQPNEIPDEVEFIDRLCDALEELSIPEEEIKVRQMAAFGILRERKIPYTRHSWGIDEDIGDEAVHFNIQVSVDVETLLELESQLVERVFEEIPNPHIGRFVVGYQLQQ